MPPQAIHINIFFLHLVAYSWGHVSLIVFRLHHHDYICGVDERSEPPPHYKDRDEGIWPFFYISIYQSIFRHNSKVGYCIYIDNSH